MKEEKIVKIFNILNKYVNNYINRDVIDYYDLFELDKNSTCEEISAKLKSLKLLLHPDLESYLPEFMQSYFMELHQEFKNCEGVFSDKVVREKYDQKLNTSNNKENKAEKASQDYDNQSTTDESISGFELESIMNAVKLTGKLHGLSFVMYNVLEILEAQNSFRWELRFSKDSRADLKKVGLEKFKKIIKKFSIPSTDNIETTLDYFSYLYQNDPEVREQILPFERACYDTLDKYKDVQQLNVAINRYVNDNCTMLFTNRNGYRDALVNMNSVDVIPFIRVYLNSFKHQNSSYCYENLKTVPRDTLIELFAHKYYEENKVNMNESRK